MKSKKYGFYCSIGILIISFILLWYCKESCGVVHDILIGIFGSVVVTSIITISDYYIAKKEALEDYYFEAFKIIHAIYNIKYVHISDSVIKSAKYKVNMDLNSMLGKTKANMDEILKYYEDTHYFDNYPSELSESGKKKIILCNVNDDCKNILKAVESYIEFSSIDLGQLENAYGKLSFISEIFLETGDEKCLKYWVYNNLHIELRDLINTIRETSYHFKSFVEGENKNVEVIANKVKALNKKLFKIEANKNNKNNEDNNEEKEEDRGSEQICEVYAEFYNNIRVTLESFRSKIYNCEPNKIMIAPIYTYRIINK